MQYILTVDQSTFSTKVLLIDENTKVIDTASYKHKQYYPNPGWVEHDPIEIYENLLKAINEIKNKNINEFKNVIALSITNQRETTVLWDKTTGLPIYNAIVWQCRRTTNICEFLRKYESEVSEKTGLKIDPYFSATKIKWLLDNNKLNEDHTYGFGTIESWLIYKLTNGEKHVSDVSNASRTLLFNINTLKWDERLCEIFNIPMDILPEIRNNDEIFGETDINNILDNKVKICGVIGDSQASLYAQNCLNRGDAKVTLGTGSSILVNIGNKNENNQKETVTTIGWKTENNTVYAKEAIINCSCDTLNWMREQMNLYKDDSELEKIWNETRHNEGVYLVPAFVGLSVPWWDEKARASIVGIARNHNYKNIIRAGMEAICYQIYDAVTSLGFKKGSILFVDGGASKNKSLIQFISDILEVEIQVGDETNLSALGSYFICRKKILNKSNDVIKKLSYFPNMNDELRKKNLEGWHKAVQSVLSK